MAYQMNFCETKEQLKHLGEVVTGKVDGSPTGADIETSKLNYTGQVRKTLPALEGEYDKSISDKESEADAAIDAYRLLSKGPYSAGIELEDKFQYITYNSESYFAVTPPYTTTATTPDADVNLFAGGYLVAQQLSLYTDMVYKASGGNSAVENMINENPISSAIGDILKTGHTSWIKKEDSPATADNFRALGYVSVTDCGAVGNYDSTSNTGNDDTQAFIKARSYGWPIFIPPAEKGKSYYINQDFTIFTGMTVKGCGESSLITLDNCWFGADGIVANQSISHWKISDISLMRINSLSANDPVFVVRGDNDISGARDVYRYEVDNVHVVSNTNTSGDREGIGYDLQSTYLGTVINPVVQGSKRGLNLTQRPGRNTGVNSVDFFGGEIQTCDEVAYMYDVSSCTITTAFEGGAVHGVWINGECNALKFSTTYMESNASYDFRLSSTVSGVPNVGVSFEQITVRNGNKTKNHSIILDNVIGVTIDGYYEKGPTGVDTSIIGNNGDGSIVQGTYKNVVNAFHNTYRASPIAPESEAVGTPLCDNETYGFYNLNRSTYETNFTQANSGTSEVTLRSWTINEFTLSRFGVPIEFVATGDFSSDNGDKTLSLYFDGSLVKNFSSTEVGKDFYFNCELIINEAVSSNYMLMITYLVDGQVQQYFSPVIADTGSATVELRGTSDVPAALRLKSSYYRIKR